MVREVNEGSRVRTEGSAAHGGYPPAVEAAIARFGEEQGARPRSLTPAQVTCLEALLAEPNGNDQARVYIALICAGAAPNFVVGDAASRRRFDLCLDGAAKVWAGRGVTIRGETAEERLRAYAQALVAAHRKHGSLNDDAVREVRQAVIGTRGWDTVDSFSQPLPEMERIKPNAAPAVRPDAPSTRPGGGTATTPGGERPTTPTGETPRPGTGSPTTPATGATTSVDNTRPAPQDVRHLDLAGMRAATASGDFEAAERNLNATYNILRDEPRRVNQQELEAYLADLDTLAKKAEEHDKNGFWDILLAVLTLGISLLVDHFHDSPAEKVIALNKKVRARVALNEHDPEETILRSVNGDMIPERRRPGVDKIPGTNEPWSAARVAQILHESTDGMGTSDEQRLLDITHGLHVEDRIAIADEFAQRRGWSERGRPALDKLYRHLVDELDDNPFWQTRDGMIIKAQFDPRNQTGTLLPHHLIHLDLDGLISKDGAAIHRLLMRSDEQQIRAIDLAYRETYGESLEDALKRLGGDDEATALFLLRAPRRDGEVPIEYVRAFKLREAMEQRAFFGLIDTGTDENSIFRMLEQMSGEEFLATAKAYKELNGRLWHDDMVGDDGSSGDPRRTALYHQLHGELDDFIGGDDLWLQRLSLASQGLRFVADPSQTPEQQEEAERAHRERVATYAALTFGLSGNGKTGDADVAASLAMVQPYTPGQDVPLNGLPSASHVTQEFARRFPGQNIFSSINKGARGVTETIAELTLGGRGTPEALAAARIKRALDDNDPATLYQILDRPDLPVAERERFVRGVQAEYARQFTQNDAQGLRKALEEEFGRDIDVGGRRYPSRALRLLEQGTLTPGERLVYATHERVIFNLFGKTEEDTILQTVERLSPLEKVAAMQVYADIVGKPFNLAAGQNPLRDDLKELSAREMRRAEFLMNIMPQDIDMLAFDTAMILERQADPVVEQWIRENVGDPQEWLSRNFPDVDPNTPGIQNPGIDRLRGMVEVAGGVAPFATSIAMTPEQFLTESRNLVESARRNGAVQFLTDFLGPQGRHLEVYGRKLYQATRELALAREDLAVAEGAATKDTRRIAQLQGRVDEASRAVETVHQEAYAAARNLDILTDERAEIASNVVTTALVIAFIAAAPEASPLLVGLAGGAGKAATHLAFGETRPLTLGRQFALGFVLGAGGSMAAANMAQLSPNVSIWLRALHGGLEAAKAGAMYGMTYRMTDARNWRYGLAHGMREAVAGTIADLPEQFVTGAAFTAAMDLLNRGWDSLRDNGDGPKPPADGPGGGDPPGGDPTDPGTPPAGNGPGGRPTVPTDPPVGPGGRPTVPTDPPVGPGGRPTTPINPPAGGGTPTPPSNPTPTTPTTPTNPTNPTPPTGGGTGGTGGRPSSGTPSGTGGRPGTTPPTPPPSGGSTPPTPPPSGGSTPPTPPPSGGGTTPPTPPPTGGGTTPPPTGGGTGPRPGGVTPPTPPPTGGGSTPPTPPPTGGGTTPPPSGGGTGPRPGGVTPPTPPTGGTGTTPPTTTLPGEPAAAQAARWAWSDAVAQGSALGTQAIILGTESQAWAQNVMRTRRPPSPAAWASLIERARAMGIDVPAEAPRTYAGALALLDGIRRGAVNRAAGDPATPATPSDRTPATPSDRTPTPSDRTPATPSDRTPTPSDRTPATPSDRTPTPSDRTPATPSDRTPATPSDRTPATPSDRTPTPSDRTPATPSDRTPVTPTDRTPATPADGARIEALRSHPALAREDEGWLREHGASAVAFLLGKPASELEGKSGEEIVAALRADSVYGSRTTSLREAVREKQRQLTAFGYPSNLVDGIVGPKTLEAFGHAEAIFGDAAKGGKRAVVDNLDAYADVMRQAAAARGGSAPRTRREMQDAVDAYKRGLAQSGDTKPGATTPQGEVDRATMEATRARQERIAREQAAQASTATARTRIETQKTELLGAIQRIQSGQISEADVKTALTALGELRTARASNTDAVAAYEVGMRALERALRDEARLVTFIKHGANAGQDASLQATVWDEIVSRMTPEAQRSLSVAMWAADVNFDRLPLVMLDSLDERFHKEAWREPAGRYGRLHQPELAGLALREAAARTKDLGKLLREDAAFVYNDIQVSRLAQRLSDANLSGDNEAHQAMLKPLIDALRSQVNGGRSQRTVEVIQTLSDHDPELAGYFIRALFANDKINWSIRDDLAFALCKARDGEANEAGYDGMIDRLDRQTQNLLRDQLDDSWVDTGHGEAARYLDNR